MKSRTKIEGFGKKGSQENICTTAEGNKKLHSEELHNLHYSQNVLLGPSNKGG
jgi:hypothetical protein